MSAIEKINAEMQKDPQNKYMEIIGHYVIDRCADTAVAAKIDESKKTLAGAMSAVVTAAKKKAKGNVAVLMPEEVFAEVDSYFGIAPDEKAQVAAMLSGGVAPAPVPAQKGKMDLTLEDFI